MCWFCKFFTVLNNFFLKGTQSAWFTVVASNFLPVHITSLDKADTVYKKHAGHTLLKVRRHALMIA